MNGCFSLYLFFCMVWFQMFVSNSNEQLCKEHLKFPDLAWSPMIKSANPGFRGVKVSLPPTISSSTKS